MKLKEWFAREKISIAAAARNLGIHENHLYLVLNGKRFPGYYLAKSIEEFTSGEITLEELIKPKPPTPKCPHCGRAMPREKKEQKNIGLNE